MSPELHQKTSSSADMQPGRRQVRFPHTDSVRQCITSMFQHPCADYDNILTRFFSAGPVQASAADIARDSMQGRKLHLRALCTSLSMTRRSLDGVLQELVKHAR